MSLVLPREEEVENIFSRILSSKQSCERLMETFYDHLCDDNRYMDPDPHHFAEVLLNAYKNGDVSALLLELCNRSMFDLLKESYLIPRRFHGKCGENPVLLTDVDGDLLEEEKAVVAKQVTHYKEYQSLIYNGDYYRLANPFEDGMSAWSWISEDKKTILVQGVLFRAKPNVLRKTLRLMGLEAKKNYKIAGTEEVYTGVALMSGGVLLQRAVGDDVSFEIVLEEI